MFLAASARKKALGLLLAGAALPATITCDPGVRFVEFWGPPVVVEEYYYEEPILVEEGGDGFGFDFFYEWF